MEVLSQTTSSFNLKLEEVKYMYLQKENLKTNLRNHGIIPNVKNFAKTSGISNRLYIVGFYKQNIPTEKYDDMCCTTWMAVSIKTLPTA